MTTFMASVRDKKTKELKVIKSEYKYKKDFYSDLIGNGYAVRFIATEEKFDDECEKYYTKLEKQNEMNYYRRKVKKELIEKGLWK